MQHDKTIISPKNPSIKNVVRLRERKERDRTGLTIVEGFREVLRAFESHVKFRELYVCPSLFHDNGTQRLVRDIEKENTKVFETTKEIFAKISFGDRQEGILGICEKPKLSLQDLKLSLKSLLVIVESVEKPGNLGAILRTCDGAGADGLILCDNLTDSYNPNVVRASLGTVFSVKVIESSNQQAFSFLRGNHIKICATVPNAKTIYTDVNFNIPLGIVVGSEQKGLSDFWVKNADTKVKIPMHGGADSLNVSATAAILIYEAIRQRKL